MDNQAHPRIAISVALAERQAEPALAARKNELYAEAIARHGGEAILIDESASAETRRELFARMDEIGRAHV